MEDLLPGTQARFDLCLTFDFLLATSRTDLFDLGLFAAPSDCCLACPWQTPPPRLPQTSPSPLVTNPPSSEGGASKARRRACPKPTPPKPTPPKPTPLPLNQTRPLPPPRQVKVKIHKVRQRGLHRWPVQLELLDVRLAPLVVQPDEWRSPCDVDWAYAQGWDIDQARGAARALPLCCFASSSFALRALVLCVCAACAYASVSVSCALVFFVVSVLCVVVCARVVRGCVARGRQCLPAYGATTRPQRPPAPAPSPSKRLATPPPCALAQVSQAINGHPYRPTVFNLEPDMSTVGGGLREGFLFLVGASRCSGCLGGPSGVGASSAGAFGGELEPPVCRAGPSRQRQAHAPRQHATPRRAQSAKPLQLLPCPIATPFDPTKPAKQTNLKAAEARQFEYGKDEPDINAYSGARSGVNVWLLGKSADWGVAGRRRLVESTRAAVGLRRRARV
jgi:hypothetical protein